MSEKENTKLIDELINNKNQILEQYYQEYRSESKNTNFIKILDGFLANIKQDKNAVNSFWIYLVKKSII